MIENKSVLISIIFNYKLKNLFLIVMKQLTKNTLMYYLLILILFSLSSCKNEKTSHKLFLPDGFKHQVYIDSIGEKLRHMAVSQNGNLYVKFRRESKQGILAGIKDYDGDGKYDSLIKFGKYHKPQRGSYSTGARIHNGYLYYSNHLTVYRVKLDNNQIVPKSDPEIIVIDDHEHGSHEHIAKPIAFDDDGNIYVPFGSPNNACQEPKRTPLIPGQYPCPDLIHHGGIWKFDANKTNQTQNDGELFATGLRSIVAMDWNSYDKSLYAVVHGRDDLSRLWPNHFNTWESAILPSEEFVKIDEGDDFGWPYCYYDQVKNKKVLAPEYGGDGDVIGMCSDFKDPVIGFPGHWAPNDLVFYKGDAFPERYKNGAFIAFHGSTNRIPYPQSGYFVAFVPFKDGVAGEFEIFADGFAAVDPIVNTRDAKFRPMGISFSLDGSMFISDSRHGRVWKINYDLDKNDFDLTQLEKMEKRKTLSHIRNPDRLKDRIELESNGLGQNLYNKHCVSCHQIDGQGASGRFPTLVSNWVQGDKKELIQIVLNGIEGDLEVNGEIYNGIMPHYNFLTDDQIADLLTYIRKSFGNNSSEITMDEVEEVRKQTTNSKP